jgi:hypothetical protein
MDLDEFVGRDAGRDQTRTNNLPRHLEICTLLAVDSEGRLFE